MKQEWQKSPAGTRQTDGKNLVWFGELESKLAKLSKTTFTYRSALPPCVEASNAQSGPFALQVAGKQLVSYDDVESVRRKAEYVKAEGLAGASLSTLDLDDFNNLCCQVRGHYMFSVLQESILRLRIRVTGCACKKSKLLLILILVNWRLGYFSYLILKGLLHKISKKPLDVNNF